VIAPPGRVPIGLQLQPCDACDGTSLIAATSISFFISLVGAGILLSDKVPQGTVIESPLARVSGVRCTQLAKDTNDRLDKLWVEVEEDKS